LVSFQDFSCPEYVKYIKMHELAIAENLVNIVKDVADGEKLSKVTKVTVCFGTMVQVVPDLFETAFRAAVDGTLACDALLDIETIPLRLRCNACNTVSEPDEYCFLCSKCGSADIEIETGRELFVKSIEGE